MRSKLLSILSVLGLLALGTAIAAQNPPPPPPKPPAEQEKPKPPAKKAKKVWTIDDVKELRKPSDEYAEQKDKAAEEAAKAKEEGGKPETAEGEAAANPEVDPEDTPEAIEKQIANWESDKKRAEERFELARKEMIESKDRDSYDTAKYKMDIYEGNIADYEKKIAALKVKLEAAKKNAKPGTKPAEAPAQPPSPPPAQ